MARSRKFYEGVLGLKPTMITESDSSKWTEYDIGATTLSLGESPAFPPSRDGAGAALEVENFEQAIADLKKAGAPFFMEPFETPVCFMAFVTDPDGSKICIHKRKPGHN
jgi:predicted enzyme related to lactoylglutathione lyase